MLISLVGLAEVVDALQPLYNPLMKERFKPSVESIYFPHNVQIMIFIRFWCAITWK